MLKKTLGTFEQVNCTVQNIHMIVRSENLQGYTQRIVRIKIYR